MKSARKILTRSPLLSPLAAVAVALVLSSNPLAAVAGGFLKIGDIKGEATDSRHDGWIVISSVNWSSGSEPTPVPAGRSKGETTLGDVVVVRSLDASSPKLQEACASGNHFPTANLRMERPGGNPDRPVYTDYKLYDVTLTCGASSDGRPREEFSLKFGRAEVEQVAAPAAAEQAPLRPQRATPRPAVRGAQSGVN